MADDKQPRPRYIDYQPKCHNDAQLCEVGDLLMDGARPRLTLREVPRLEKSNCPHAIENDGFKAEPRVLMRFRFVPLPRPGSWYCQQCRREMLEKPGYRESIVVCSGRCPESQAWIRIS